MVNYYITLYIGGTFNQYDVESNNEDIIMNNELLAME